MKILFVIKDVEYIDPMGIMLLSALARRGGHTTEVAVLGDGGFEEKVRSCGPDVVAFSAKTGEHKYYLAAAAAVKRVSPSIRTVIGGPHATFFPEIIERDEVDLLCMGEGDDAWPELLEAMESGGCVDSIANIVTKENYRSGGAPGMRPRRTALDDLPFLDRDLFYRTTRLGRFPMRSFMVGRGCPYRCTYCFNHTYNALYRGKGPLLVRMSVGRVVEELRELKARYDTQFIKFYDDIFVFSDDEWLDEFVERYRRDVGLPFHCLMRANLLTEPILKKLKEAGLASISMSIESGDDRIRNDILKRRMSRETLVRAFELCARHDVPTFSNTILAVPGSSIEDDIESLDLNLACKVTFGEFPVFFPYPRTELADYAIETGCFDGDFDRLHMSYQSESPLDCFDEREKLMQKNLSLLATVCLLFPRLRNVTVNRLIGLPLTRLYFYIYYVVKAYLVKTRIYPMRFSPLQALRSLYESFRLERFKHEEEDLLRRTGGP
ncbi:MAG TPA: B12-binding domain-containing radical SAM protein [Deltaproteobacteria bacterium]|nr:B12-binding domain-containing radical SAM protein [Deltaproteobacteria bacterium]